MNLIFKHTVRSVRNKPLKSLIVILILTVATVMTAFSYEALAALGREEAARNESTFDNADIVVTSNGSSANVIAKKYFDDFLEEGDVISGYYTLPFFDGDGQSVLGAATDFYGIDEIFNISFTEYSGIKASEIDSCILVSSRYAREKSLTTGQKTEYTFFGEKLEYTVCGISEYPFFGSYDFIINMTGIMNIMTSKISYLAVFDESDFLFSSAYIRLADPSRAEALKESMENGAYGNFVYTVRDEMKNRGFDYSILYLIFVVMALLVFAIASVLAYNAFNTILAERSDQHAAFALAGTDAGRITLGFAVETAVYTVIASLVGFALTAGLVRVFEGVLDFIFTSLEFSWKGMLCAFVGEVAVGTAVVAAMSRNLRADALRREKKYSFLPAVVSLCVIAVGIIVLLVIPAEYNCYAAIITTSAVMVFTITVLPALMTRCLSCEKARKRPVRSVPFLYARKNLSAVAELKNVCSMIGVITVAVIGLSVCIGYGYRQYEVSQSFFECDYVIVNSSEQDIEKIKALDGVDAVSSFYSAEASIGDKNALFVSIEDVSFVGRDLQLRSLPKGNRLIISQPAAELYGVENGGTLTLEIDGKEISFVAEYNYVNVGYIVFFDASYADIGTKSYLIRAEDGKEKEVLKEIVAETEGKAVYVDDVKSVLDKTRRRAFIFISAISVFFWLNLAGAAIGVINVIASSYMKRKEEFRAYSLCGMSRKDLTAMKISEIMLAVCLSVAVALIPSLTVTWLIDMSMRSFGYSLIGYSLF